MTKGKYSFHYPACAVAFGYKEPAMRFLLGEATARDEEIIRIMERIPVNTFRYAREPLIINLAHGVFMDKSGNIRDLNGSLLFSLDGKITRLQQWFRRTRKLRAAAEYLSHPSSEYQQLVNCGAPARQHQFGIRVLIEIPGHPVKEPWKQLDSLRASGFSLAQIFGKDETPRGSTSTKRTKKPRKQTRPRRLLRALPEQ